MIPKTIHYCWFGRNPKPELAEKCIKSWKKRCPEYDIIEWNEDNFDISSCPLYVRQAYETKKWAFVTDYVRLKVVHDHGGIYLDTDVQLKKNLDELLRHEAFFAFEDDVHINTGLGFGAEANNPVVACMMKDYEKATFCKLDGSYEYITCPDRNTQAIADLLRHAEDLDDGIEKIEGAVLYPKEYFCPLDWKTKELNLTEKTFSIHWYDASWLKEDQQMLKEYHACCHKLSRFFGKRGGNWMTRKLYAIVFPEKWNRIKRM